MNGPFGLSPALLMFISVTWGFVVTVFWMACAWRAMRAHERIVEKLEQLTALPK